ncbi:MAG TPA: ATP-binding protein [Candidatus Fimimorpha faecalis]|mgnify:FL=1|uniref:ATP-binding protein n=1 Tax=Candidatus Fimimorpha faecalis TaxID=2840824 RepID=A0A9D1JD82_9FIRM|nr:ATP-binding protein [Candidatus Fimimorpha faecalis]
MKESEKIRQLIQLEEELKKMKSEYEERLLEVENNIRIYQHDMENHLICLMELAYEENANRVMNYVKELKNDFVDRKKQFYQTGNFIVDVLLNHYVSLLSDDVKKDVKGKWIQDLDVTEVELCSVFSNLMQNAVEALIKPITNKKYLEIKFVQGKTYAKLEIKNSLERLPEQDRQGNLISTKEDRKKHGIGLMNVRRIVEKNGGKFEIEMTKEEFKSIVILKLKENL